jgi:hypothetical protein
VEGMELKEEGTPSEEKATQIVVSFGWPKGEGMELDERGMRRGGLVEQS